MSTAAVDPSRCPLCGQANACAMVEGGSTCWCFEVAIPGEVLARIPAEAEGVACVCRRCAAGQTAPAATLEGGDEPGQKP